MTQPITDAPPFGLSNSGNSAPSPPFGVVCSCGFSANTGVPAYDKDTYAIHIDDGCPSTSHRETWVDAIFSGYGVLIVTLIVLALIGIFGRM
jgi:hypothetical protein